MKKRILSALLALCMVFALGTVGAMAEGPGAETHPSTTKTIYVNEGGVENGATPDTEKPTFKYLRGAINYATPGDTIIIEYDLDAANGAALSDSNAYGVYTINKDLTIQGAGDGITITASGSDIQNRDIHVFNITSGKVTIENITIEGVKASHYIKHGIHVYDNADVTLKDVTVNNCYGYGLVVNNGGSVEATDFSATGNGWGGVNVDAKSNKASLTMTDSTVTGNGSEKDVSVVLDSKTGGENTVELVGGTYNKVMTNTQDEKGEERSVGTSDVTISKSKIDNLSLNGTGTDKVQIKDNATVGTITGSNNQSGSRVSVTESTVTSAPASLGFTLTYVNANVGDKTGVTSDGIVATIDGEGYETLKAALEEANKATGDEPVVIELLGNDSSLGQINMTLKQDIQINGGGHTVTVSPANITSTTKAFTLQGATLTLNNVKMNISGTQSSNNTGYDGTAFDVQNNGSELKLIGGTKLTLDELESAIVFTTKVSSAENMGKITMDGDSTLTITTIDGNVSNGGVWNINGSDITVNGCGSHALSTEKFTASGDSKISVTDAGMFALYGTVIDLRDSTELTVTNCGSKIDGTLGSSEPTYKYQSPVQIKSTGTIIGTPSMTVAENAQVTVTGTKDGNDTIFVPDNATYESASADVSATIKTKEVGEDETPSIFVVNYVVNGNVVYTESTNNSSYKISDPSEVNAETTNFDCWLVGTEKHAPGTTITLTASTTDFTAKYSEPVVPEPDKYSINLVINNGEGGSASVNKNIAAKGEKVTVSVSTKTGYISGVRVVTASGTPVTMSDTSFTMPDESVTVTVTFTATTTPPEETTEYDIHVLSANYGYVSAESTAAQGETVYISIYPNNGYVLNTLRVYRGNNITVSTYQVSDTVYRFTMPAEDVTIVPTFKLDNEFDINLSYNRNYGSVTARVDGDVTYVAQEYDRVYIYTEPNKGYMVKDVTVSIDAWDEVEVELEREGVYSFRMPDADVEVEVTFAPGYEITIDDDIRYGEITTDPEDYAAEDDTVEVYFKPSNGYKLKTIEVFTGKDFDDEVTVRLHSSGDYYRFTMPDGDVYITAEFERTTMPFTDVRTTDWYYDEVLYVYNNGLMEGVSSYSFNPSGTMTREMFWAVLGRIDGQSITGTNWASQARSWAMNEGVSDGTNPTSLITREEMVTMLWRYAGSRAASGGLSRFNDASTISSWASTAMSWAVNNGIIDGVTSNTIQPRGTADRAQCAAIFMRYDQM